MAKPYGLAVAALVWLLVGRPATAPAATLESALVELDSALVRNVAELQQVKLDRLARAAAGLEAAAAQATMPGQPRPPAFVLASTERFLAAKTRVDWHLDQTLALRTGAAAAAQAASDPQQGRQLLRNFLRVTSQLIDLSGRMRYLSFDVLRTAVGELAESPPHRRQLIDLMLRYRCAPGASILADALQDPDPTERMAMPPVTYQERAWLLELIAATGQTELLPDLERLVRTSMDPRLVIQAAEVITRVGLPQEPGPGQDPTLPKPAVTARRLKAALARVNPALLESTWRDRLSAVLAFLDGRITRGIPFDRSLVIGPCAVQPGDWLLMRNPSPYNLFTDLSPGLFTHVGVVAWEKGSDGIGRIVLVDLPERGTSIPATNVDTFIKRTRHYVFLRHKDPEIAKAMGEAAGSVIGNPSQFDMNFRTDRVLELAHQPLAGKKIHTYCAGLLLLCALQTPAPREDFFPITETHAGGLSAENLATLGMSFGEGFISPTGALFSNQMEIVGRCEPNYDPRREVEEAIFDYFATRLTVQRLNASPDMFQALRLKIAVAAKDNSLLAAALAKAAGVSPEMDLVAAAKAVAVVEILDEVAYGASAQFLAAMDAVKGTPPGDAGQPTSAEAANNAARYRQLHAGLVSLWQQQRISPRALRQELVKYYIQQGQRQIDQRFFAAPAAAAK